MNREPDPDGGSEFGDGPHADRLGPREPDEFDAIVAGWRSEGDVPRWPDAEPETVAISLPAAASRPPEPPELDEHFVPPEPPPLPRLGPPAVVGLALIVLGIVLIAAPGWVGVPSTYGLPLGLVSIASGLGWLVLRLWPDHSADGPDEGDNGAIL